MWKARAALALALALRLALPLAVIAGSVPLAAQSVADHNAMGAKASAAHDLPTAIAHFDAALALDSMSAEANWRMALALIDQGRQAGDTTANARRDSLYARAERFARRSVAADSMDAQGHFALANAVGRASLSKGKKERLKRATEIRDEALRAIELNPKHDGAYHILGRWNFELMRLSGLSRFFAKSFLGGGVVKQASWEGAITNMEKAVALDPSRITHHLDLAQVYIERDRYSDARTQLAEVEALPATDIMDPKYKRTAAILLEKIAGKKDGD